MRPARHAAETLIRYQRDQDRSSLPSEGNTSRSRVPFIDTDERSDSEDWQDPIAAPPEAPQGIPGIRMGSAETSAEGSVPSFSSVAGSSGEATVSNEIIGGGSNTLEDEGMDPTLNPKQSSSMPSGDYTRTSGEAKPEQLQEARDSSSGSQVTGPNCVAVDAQLRINALYPHGRRAQDWYVVTVALDFLSFIYVALFYQVRSD